MSAPCYGELNTICNDNTCNQSSQIKYIFILIMIVVFCGIYHNLTIVFPISSQYTSWKPRAKLSSLVENADGNVPFVS